MKTPDIPDAAAAPRLLLVEDHVGLAEVTQEFLQSEGLKSGLHRPAAKLWRRRVHSNRISFYVICICRI